jgi:hypothetical protein
MLQACQDDHEGRLSCHLKQQDYSQFGDTLFEGLEDCPGNSKSRIARVFKFYVERVNAS